MFTENTLTNRTDQRDPDAIDQQFCWEQVLRIRPSFRLSFPYARAEFSDGILALYALFSAIEEVHCRVGDEGVARVKLAWWHQQLLGEEYSTSAHPITRKLFRTDAIPRGARAHLQGMLKADMDRLDAPAPADEHELKTMCADLGLHPMRLEAAFQDEAEQCAGQEAACAVNGLVQLLRESSRASNNPFWWVPLNYLAREGLTRSDLAQGSPPQPVRQIMSRVCQLGLNWVNPETLLNRDGKFRNFTKQDRRQIMVLRHWLIQSALQVRLLRKLSGLSPRKYAGRFASTAPGDAWFTWRQARKYAQGGA